MSEDKYSYEILYVEDEAEVRRNYVSYLKRFFHTVHEAGDAKEALKIYQTKNPSILIVDINLPGKSGVDFLKEIREGDHAIKAIMLTANSDVETLVAATELKLTKYLIKPVSRLDLKNALFLAMEEMLNYRTIANKIIKMKDSCYWDQENKKLMKEDEALNLTKKEIELLSLLFTNTRKTFSSDDIIYELWYDADEPKNDALKTLIKHLRKKLPKDTIKNVFGVGYKIEAQT